jgi:phosphohistidine phosphatase
MIMMQIWLVRHAIAVEPEEFSGTDAERPLTEKGIRKFKEFAEWLAEEATGPEIILTSPLVRAVQTAELLAKAFGHKKKEVVQESTLGPGCTPHAILEAAASHGAGRVAIVGHQPDLAINTAALLGGGDVVFDKGCVAAIELPRLAVGSGRLLWFVGPKLRGG